MSSSSSLADMEADKVSYTDLLIVGAGPAGLMAAAWASQYNISARIIDKKNTRVTRGHADGLQCRTMEILDSFGLVDQIRKKGFHCIEICSWDPLGDHGIQRTQRVLSQKVGVSRFPQAIIHQGYIEQTLLDFLEHNGGPHVERNAAPSKISVDYSLIDQQDTYPITVKVESREGCPEVNEDSESLEFANGGRWSENKDSCATELVGRERKNQSKVKSNGIEAFRSISDGLEAEDGSTNGKFDGKWDRPIESSRHETNGIAPCATDKNPKSTTNGGPEPKSDVETIKAKYLLGCDGAHSWTRQELGIPLEGSQTQHVWGVIDIIPITDFPDIRQTCVIRSAAHGNIMIAPREGKLIRMYIQLNEMGYKDANDSARSEITPGLILEAAQKILKPYTLDSKYLDWWSVYRIQQRVAPQFSIANRIFLAGDAIHTHSPKLGQGMNVSMQDTYNLGWKLCSVINGTARPEILSTYETERRQVALNLIAVDRQIANYYYHDSSQPPDLPSDAALPHPHHHHRHQPADYQSLRDSLYEFLSGAAVNYGPSILTAKKNQPADVPSTNGDGGDDNGDEPVVVLSSRRPATNPLASNLHIGARLPSHKIINQSDARSLHLADLLPSTGRWRILVFAGDLVTTSSPQFLRMQRLGEYLASSLLQTYTPITQPIDSVIEVLSVHAGPRVGVELLSLHEVFHPFDERDGWDYWKVFVDEASVLDEGGFGDVYGKYGIDRERGCVVICRPDQHVGCVLDLEDFGGMSEYFEGILIPVV